MSTFIKIKFHVKKSAIKWLRVKRFLRKIEKVLISKEMLFKKITIMRENGESLKIKVSICNIPIEAANICNIIPRPKISNGLIVVKLKRGLKYRVHVYFEPVRPHIVFQDLLIRNLIIDFMKMYLLQSVSQVRTCLSFLILLISKRID